MNKKLLLLSALGVFTLGAAQAQTTVFEENFNAIQNWPSTSWVQHNIDGKTPDPAMGAVSAAFTATAPWGLLSFTNAPDNSFVASTSWFTVPGQANRWLVSPSIDLSAYTGGTVSLTFKTQSGGDEDYLDGYNLFVSTTGTAVANFGNTAVHSETGATSGEWSTQTVDLTPYIGSTIHLGWQHNGNDAVYLLMDDVKVTYTQGASTADFFNKNFSLYPNPTSDVLHLEARNGVEIASVQVIDMMGRVVKTQKGGQSIQVADLASGTYSIEIQSAEGKATSKFIKK